MGTTNRCWDPYRKPEAIFMFESTGSDSEATLSLSPVDILRFGVIRGRLELENMCAFLRHSRNTIARPCSGFDGC